MNATAIKTKVHNRSPLRFSVNGRQFMVSYLDQDGDGPFGVKFTWLRHANACTWVQHITEDGGCTYLQARSYLMLGGLDVECRALAPENDWEKRFLASEPKALAYRPISSLDFDCAEGF